MARLIDPWIARPIAKRLAGDDGFAGSYLLERLRRDLAEAVPRSEELVAKVSMIPAPPPATWELIGRAQWADANIKSLAALLEPLSERIGRRLEGAPRAVRLAQRAVVSVEVGALLGYVSRRVLGQFDLLVTETTDEQGGTIYFVAPNLVETERRYGFVPEEFAFWVALHEVTHRFQFDGVPWLRPRFMGLVRTYMESADLDARGLAKRMAAAGSRLISKTVPAEEKNPMYLFASEDQRTILDEIQALMSVVEGHGNFVMDHIGAQTIRSFNRMRHIFDRRRRQASALQRAVGYAIGLEMKMRQYELGHSFCKAVVSRGGLEALARLWGDPEDFPTMTELREPDLWLRRLAIAR